MKIHSWEPGNKSGFEKGSSIRYSESWSKSHRRLDQTIRDEDIEELKFRNKLAGKASKCRVC